ncbi:MAG: hypothetical protein U5J83_13625 [Bryobacterales bacterium]|nr:hypothetical protein [Bryobacterales bacterium]
MAKTLASAMLWFEWMNSPTAGPYPIPVLDRDEIDTDPRFPVFRLFSSISAIDIRSIHRYLRASEKPRKCANMVFMSMSDKNGTQPIDIVQHIGEIRYDDIDARHFFVRTMPQSTRIMS